jgi:hypothetical protein
MNRNLDPELVEGEVALVIQYDQGKAHALDVLHGTMQLIEAIDGLDKTLLSGVDTSLEPVSILNDVEHSSLKLLLSRAIRSVPDDAINSLEWKKFVGSLLVKGKNLLLQKLDPSPSEVQGALVTLEKDFPKIPGSTLGYCAPRVEEVIESLRWVMTARSLFRGHKVLFQTELGDISLEDHDDPKAVKSITDVVTRRIINRGTEFFKVKSPDMLGTSQWTLIRHGKQIHVSIMDRAWLDAYHQRKYGVLPGDSLECEFEEQIGYDAEQNEVERRLSIIEVLGVVSPPKQTSLLPPS